MGHVFISYSRRDSAYAARLVWYLEQSGIAVFHDSNIGYSSQWWRVIVDRVKACAAMIVVMTPALDSSDWVMKEVLLARHAKKPVFPLLLQGDPYPLLIDVQHLDVTSCAMPSLDFVEALRVAVADNAGAATFRPAIARGNIVGAQLIVRSNLNLDALAMRVERAHDTLQMCRSLDPGPGQTLPMLLRKARALEDLMEIYGCLAACDEVLGVEPENVDAMVIKARMLDELGYHDNALVLVTDVLVQHPDHVDALIIKSDVSRAQEIGGGEVLVDRALALEPDNAYALAVKARYFTGRNDGLAADRLLDRATAIAPDSLAVCMARIVRDFDKEQFAKGLEELEALIRVFPRSPLLRMYLALTRLSMILYAGELGREQSRKMEALGHGLLAMGIEFGAPAGRVVAGCGHFALAMVHMLAGHPAYADAEMAQAEALVAGTSPVIIQTMASFRVRFIGLMALFSRFRSGDYYVLPNIPAEKLRAARVSCGLDSSDLVFALIDCSRSGSAEGFIVFTPSFAAQSHSRFGADYQTKLPYSSLPTAIYIASGDDVVDPNSAGIYFTTAGSIISAGRIIELLDAVKAQIMILSQNTPPHAAIMG